VNKENFTRTKRMPRLYGAFWSSDALYFADFTLIQAVVQDACKFGPISRHENMEPCSGTGGIAPCTYTVETV
jgi:hypothetical protein